MLSIQVGQIETKSKSSLDIRLKRDARQNKVKGVAISVITLYTLVLTGVIVIIFQGATPADMAEVNNRINSVGYLGIKKDQIQTMKEDNKRLSFQKIVLVGMVETLKILYENRLVMDTLTSLCYFYGDTTHGGSESFLRIEILYKDQGSRKNRADATVNIENALYEEFTRYGCTPNLLSEKELLLDKTLTKEVDGRAGTRYQRLSWLRSLHRDHIIQKGRSEKLDFEVVLNMDLDIMSPPPIVSLTRTINQIAQESKAGSGLIVCANGFETWNVANMLERKLFYDTLAAVDINGNWAYKMYSTNPISLLKFSQTILLRNILKHKYGLWPMQSCFGGVAVYDYRSWAFADCDYEPRKIKLRQTRGGIFPNEAIPSSSLDASSGLIKPYLSPRPPIMRNSGTEKNEGKWMIDPKYTITGTLNGDACEHVILQQCLLHASNVAKVYRNLSIGIEPNLIIQRGAAILKRSEDYARMLAIIMKIVMVMVAVTFLVTFCFECNYMKMKCCFGFFPKIFQNYKYKA